MRVSLADTARVLGFLCFKKLRKMILIRKLPTIKRCRLLTLFGWSTKAVFVFSSYLYLGSHISKFCLNIPGSWVSKPERVAPCWLTVLPSNLLISSSSKPSSFRLTSQGSSRARDRLVQRPIRSHPRQHGREQPPAHRGEHVHASDDPRHRWPHDDHHPHIVTFDDHIVAHTTRGPPGPVLLSKWVWFKRCCGFT